MTARRGPWVREGRPGSSWRMVLVYPGCSDHVYEVEYRSREGAEQAGYYLFGPRFDGDLLLSGESESALYEATARVAQRCVLPGDTHEHIAAAARAASS